MAKKGEKVERGTVAWGLIEKKVKVGRSFQQKKVMATSSVTKKAILALGLKESKAGSSGAASAYKTTKSGANVLNRSVGGTTRGLKAYASIGERTAKGNLKWYTIPVPQGVSLERIHRACANVKFLKWKGGEPFGTPQKGAVKG
jgi:hypothetical protein